MYNIRTVFSMQPLYKIKLVQKMYNIPCNCSNFLEEDIYNTNLYATKKVRKLKESTWLIDKNVESCSWSSIPRLTSASWKSSMTLKRKGWKVFKDLSITYIQNQDRIYWLNLSSSKENRLVTIYNQFVGNNQANPVHILISISVNY